MQTYIQQYIPVGDVTKADVHVVLLKGRDSLSQVSEESNEKF